MNAPITSHKMNTAEQVLWLSFVFTLIMDVVGQDCTEFKSPLLIETNRATEGIVYMPQSGSKYKSNQMCQWTIKTEAGYCIQLDVITCTLEGRDIHGECSNDYVDVFDSIDDKDIFIGRFCGTDQGKSFKTASSKMIVRFQSNEKYEYSGFKASFQSVVPDDSDNDSKDTRIMSMAIGISLGVFGLLMIILAILLIIRYRRKKAASRTNTQAAVSNQNNYHPDGLPGGHPPSDPSYCADRYGTHINLRADGNRSVNPHIRNELLPAVTPSSVHGDPRNFRSVTPPPAYDSLDFANSGYNRMSLSPPPYDTVVKYCIETSSA